MTALIILLGGISVYIIGMRILSFNIEAGDEFACGSDEVCYCDESSNCVKKDGK